MAIAPYILSVDLGTTNVEAQLYDAHLNLIRSHGFPVQYIRDRQQVEFAANDYVERILTLLAGFNDYEIQQIVLTGQAESLVMLDQDLLPTGNIISWMDERSTLECTYIRNHFSVEEVYAVTGQSAVLPTWPATKILHLKNNDRQAFDNVHQYVLLKDYIAFVLTGTLRADKSIATFSLLFDIHRGIYWQDMLDYLGISESNLPELAEPCTTLGSLKADIANQIGQQDVQVNIGTLDHFAGMLGTGNLTQGIVTDSTGTVMALSTFADKDMLSENTKVAIHYGPFPDTLVYITVVESGGLCLDWLLKNILENVSYDQLEDQLKKKKTPGDIIFLPYLTGINAPDFDQNTVGMFYGLKAHHDRYDLALAVMEGLALILDRNVSALESYSGSVERIITTGGGAKSAIWNQIKANVTGKTVVLPDRTGVACLGAAIIGAVDLHIFSDYQAAVDQAVTQKSILEPALDNLYVEHKHYFNELYQCMLKIQNTDNA